MYESRLLHEGAVTSDAVMLLNPVSIEEVIFDVDWFMNTYGRFEWNLIVNTSSLINRQAAFRKLQVWTRVNQFQIISKNRK